MKFAQLTKNNIVYAIFELDRVPVFHPDVVIIDITEVESVKEGMVYEKETKTFREPTESEKIIDQQPIEPTEPTLEDIAEENLLETKYQTLLLEIML